MRVGSKKSERSRKRRSGEAARRRDRTYILHPMDPYPRGYSLSNTWPMRSVRSGLVIRKFGTHAVKYGVR
jgi:hypothetical protein